MDPKTEPMEGNLHILGNTQPVLVFEPSPTRVEHTQPESPPASLGKLRPNHSDGHVREDSKHSEHGKEQN